MINLKKIFMVPIISVLILIMSVSSFILYKAIINVMLADAYIMCIVTFCCIALILAIYLGTYKKGEK